MNPTVFVLQVIAVLFALAYAAVLVDLVIWNVHLRILRRRARRAGR